MADDVTSAGVNGKKKGSACMREGFRAGFVSIVGRPNVGKSTLLNSILGEKLVITSDRPQTTRNRIQGIYGDSSSQVVFIDTPGVHQARSPLNRFMVDAALSTLGDVDLVLFVVEAATPFGPREELILEALRGSSLPVILVLNKIDLVSRETLAATIARCAGIFPFREIFPLSALTGDGVPRLLDLVRSYLPEGEPFFPEDILTDLPERFVVAELIREKIFRRTREEIPYSVAVVIESFTERPDGVVAISATVHVERDSQKGIIIGKGGAMLKGIGSDARQEIERFLQARVFLELFVRVSRDWSENPQMLKEFGYR
jgi:GTP-binding protein Era